MSISRFVSSRLCWGGRRGRVRVRGTWSRALSALVSDYDSMSSSSFSPSALSLSKHVKQAREVDISSIGDVFSPYLSRNELDVSSGEKESSVCPTHYLRLGLVVDATIRKTHFLGVLMTISPQLPLDVDSTDHEAAAKAMTFRGLLPQVEIDFYRKSAGRDIRLDETYSLYVQRVLPQEEGGLIQLSFRPPLRERIQLAKQAILEALAASSVEDVRHMFFGLSKSDFKRALGALYKEHYIEKPVGRLYTKQNTKDVRAKLIAAEEAVEKETVSVLLQNLPGNIKKETLGRHVMAYINSVLHKPKAKSKANEHDKIEGSSVSQAPDQSVYSGGNEPRSFSAQSLKGIEFSISDMKIKNHKKNDILSSMAVVHFEVSGHTSRLDCFGNDEQDRTQALSLLVKQMLDGLFIGKKVTVRSADKVAAKKS